MRADRNYAALSFAQYVLQAVHKQGSRMRHSHKEEVLAGIEHFLSYFEQMNLN